MSAATPPPVEVGAQGTIASLVSREIEYFKRLDDESCRKGGGGASSSEPKPGSSLPTPKKKKKKKKAISSSSFVPSICSAVEISETTKYRNLRTEGGKLPREED
ncbi:uncharacterized protein M6B38_417185 [Iris pallida]|uniref:Uncharacterized protein n=1 Tax=Iris pallida TaxID=29817 RepID=A0AAX6FI70_IRIPA|nr:uncharacterized protein M6B38_135925 [Iris pallida]KAJ6816107.1 uncharacterized protein M6B38_417185 [Iris pallida]